MSATPPLTFRMTWTVYAIRRKGTNDYLPVGGEPDGNGKPLRRGFSWTEPVLGGGKWGPRFFPSRRSAINALISWLQGCWKQTSVQCGEFGGEVDIEVAPVTPVVPRKREDMEIVGFRITEDGDVFELGPPKSDSKKPLATTTRTAV